MAGRCEKGVADTMLTGEGGGKERQRTRCGTGEEWRAGAAKEGQIQSQFDVMLIIYG